MPKRLGVEIRATHLPRDPGKTHGKEHGRNLEPRHGPVRTAWQGEISHHVLHISLIIKLRDQVGWFTSDGAAVNRTTLRVLQNSSSMATSWSARDHDML